jgi:hypothetical protein
MKHRSSGNVAAGWPRAAGEVVIVAGSRRPAPSGAGMALSGPGFHGAVWERRS